MKGTDDCLFKVKTPSGVEIEVQTEAEKEYYEQALKKYTSQFGFENAADITALETLLTCQLLVFRFNNWLTLGSTYNGEPIDVDKITDSINKLSQRIAQLLDTLQISKKSRTEKDATPAEIVDKILKRAKEYGVRKNEVAWKFLEAYYYISSLINTHLRMNEKERIKFDLTAPSVIRKIKTVLDDIDRYEEAFRKERTLWLADIKGE